MASDAVTTTLVACAMALVTTLAVHVALQQQSRDRPLQSADNVATAPRPSTPASHHQKSPQPPSPIDLQSLPEQDVPKSLRIDAFIAPAHQAAFAHNGVFHGCTNVFAVLDAIHAYALRFFKESEWTNSSDASAPITILTPSTKRGPTSRSLYEPDQGESGRHLLWKLPACVDPSGTTEIVLFPGVDPLTFAPDKIINLPPVADSPETASGASLPADRAERRPLKTQLVVRPGAVVLGGTFDVSDGSVYLGTNVQVEPNVFIKGPAIIGDGSTLRSGAYVRGDVITGHSVVLRGELKNALVLDRAELCHPSYCGDSIVGFKSHFGNQVTTANLSLFAHSTAGNLLIDVDGKQYDTGRKKVGVVLGDWSQLGCSSVTDPCTLLRPNTVVYPLSRLCKGVYGPNQVIKNKPLERGVLEVASLQRPHD